MMAWRRVVLVPLLVVGAGCGPVAQAPDPSAPAGDPCAPNGHVHREPAGDWCHCDRGFREVGSTLGCEVDPAYRATIELGGSELSACWHVANGPFATVDLSTVPSLDEFLVYYTLRLDDDGAGLHRGRARYHAGATGAHVFSLSAAAAVALYELRADGPKKVPFLVTRATSACPGIAQQWGVSLDARATYELDLTAGLPTLGLVILQVE